MRRCTRPSEKGATEWCLPIERVRPRRAALRASLRDFRQRAAPPSPKGCTGWRRCPQLPILRPGMCQRGGPPIGHGQGQRVVAFQQRQDAGLYREVATGQLLSRADPSPGRRWQTRECSSTVQGMWNSGPSPPWPDGSTHWVMSPLEFLQRLAALVPRPRLHLIGAAGESPPGHAYFGPLRARPRVFSGPFLGRPMAFDTPVPTVIFVA